MSNRRAMMFGLKNAIGTNFLTGLVAYYSFDGSNATDIHTGTHNGTLINSPTFPTGKNGNCIEFGSTKAVSVADSNDFSFNNGSEIPFAVSMWVNFNSVSGVNFLASKWDTGIANEWLIAYNSTFFTIILSNPNTSALIRANYTFSPTVGTWYHLLFTYNANGLNSGLGIYINGSLATSTNSGTYSGMTNGATPLKMGNSDVNEYFKGKMDEVAIWKGVTYGATQATELYNAGAGKFYNTF